VSLAPEPAKPAVKAASAKPKVAKPKAKIKTPRKTTV
jgi:hypothetical protein